MGFNPVVGVAVLWIGGLASATSFIPFRGIKRWSWEIYWMVQAFVGWILVPWVTATILMPQVWSILHHAWQSNPAAIYEAGLSGLLWGVGGIAFGLSVRYLGIALAYAITLGVFLFFSRLLARLGGGGFGSLLHARSGHWFVIGLVLSFSSVVLSTFSAHFKDQEITIEEKLETGERDFSSGRGVAISILAGLMSLFFLFGLHAGTPIAALVAVEPPSSGSALTVFDLPVLVIILTGGFIANMVWSFVLIWRNESLRQFAGQPGTNPMRATATAGNTLVDFDPLDPSTYDRIAPRTVAANYFFSALAGVIWCAQFFFYGMAQSRRGTDIASGNPAILSIIVFATLWGLLLREWRETSTRTRLLATLGVLLLICSL